MRMKTVLTCRPVDNRSTGRKQGYLEVCEMSQSIVQFLRLDFSELYYPIVRTQVAHYPSRSCLSHIGTTQI